MATGELGCQQVDCPWSPDPHRLGRLEERQAMAYTTRTFRIFVSSTFDDLKAERDSLQRVVWPALRRFCQEHGARFQAIDLRWGVPEEAGIDQRTMTICLDEIHRSQRVSPRPNFIVLLGDRYGWRPLPEGIVRGEFDELFRHMPESDQGRLLSWYRLDENAVPPAMVLQPRAGRYVDYDVWTAEENHLRSILRRALDQVPPTVIGPDQRLKYEASATEREIQEGALTVPDASEHVYCFFRSIDRIERLLNDRRAQAYVDALNLGGNLQINREARDRLIHLKHQLQARLPANVEEYRARWTGGAITTGHLDKLCSDVYSRLKRVIEAELASREQLTPLDQEVETQWAFAVDRAQGFSGFVGRTGILTAIERYVAGGNLAPPPNRDQDASRPERTNPLVIFGESGSGKSALIAQAAQRARADHPRSQVVVRFVAATPGASDTRSLLDGLCRQISQAYGADQTTLPSDEQGLAEEFPRRLALATSEKPLLLFLDALDQLSNLGSSRGPNFSWLPSELPEHVRLVATSLPDVLGLKYIEARLPDTQKLLLERMTREEGNQLVTYWLRQAARTLQRDQREEVLNKFAPPDQPGGLPLYLKLGFEEARRWASYTPPANTVLAPSIPSIIRQLFARLSENANHSPLLVARSLGYLGAAKQGLSEDEMIDVLSADADVMSAFENQAHYKAESKRLPVVIWSRLYFDLEPYLTERRAEGGTMYAFYHRQLSETVAAEYLAGQVGVQRHRALAEYFGGQSIRVTGDEGTTTIRQQAAQVGQGTATVLNLRKLDELPYQQTMGELWDELFATLTNFTFLEDKAAHLGVVERTGGDGTISRTYTGVYLLQDDYALALERMPKE